MLDTARRPTSAPPGSPARFSTCKAGPDPSAVTPVHLPEGRQPRQRTQAGSSTPLRPHDARPAHRVRSCPESSWIRPRGASSPKQRSKSRAASAAASAPRRKSDRSYWMSAASMSSGCATTAVPSSAPSCRDRSRPQRHHRPPPGGSTAAHHSARLSRAEPAAPPAGVGAGRATACPQKSIDQRSGRPGPHGR